MTTYAGVDISNWQGEITPKIAECFKENLSIVVVRASLESQRLVDIAKRQIAACQAVGLQVHGYVWVYPSWNPAKTIDDAIREYGPYDLPWYWLDAEDVNDAPGPEATAAWLRTALAGLETHSVKAGIYTGAWWWNDPRYMNGSTEFRETPLWYAQYDGNPDLYTWTPFGGWLNPAGKQWDSTHEFCGINPIDRNTFADWVYQPIHAPPPVEPQPTIEQVKYGLIEKIVRDEWAAARDDILKIAPL